MLGGALGYLLGRRLLRLARLRDRRSSRSSSGSSSARSSRSATFLLGVPALLVIVFSAFSGAAAAVNGVLILFGRIKVEDLGSGHLRLAPAQRPIGVIAMVVVLVAAAAICYQIRDVGTTVTADRPERVPLLA